MARTIEQAFREFRSNLEITTLQEQTVSARQTNVRAAVARDFSVLDSFLTGSYRRHTMISPLSGADVDIFVVLDPKYFAANNQLRLLEQVRETLLKTYTSTPKIRPDGSAVTITFADFKVDVVPSFNRQGGGYLIPDSRMTRWISTDPKRHVELWAASNKAHNGNLVPLIKMIKSWNQSRDIIKSFHLETLILKALQGIRIDDDSSGVRYVFGRAVELVKVKLADPAGYSDDVAAHVNTTEQIQQLASRFSWAYQTALEAEGLARSGYISQAIDRWKLIAPNHFPSYG